MADLRAGKHIVVDLDRQRLRLQQGRNTLGSWSVSTALNGPGQEPGSECTPLGWHRVRLKIGDGCPSGTVFVARRPTGECYSTSLARDAPERDWILSRILWLTGSESGLNRGGRRDSLRRFIYIHGCPDSEPMGHPASHGCIRMRNDDVIALFDQVDTGCPVLITAGDDA